MNRTTKKCIIASVGLHSLLVLILFVGPAFFSQEKPRETYEVIELVGDITTYKTTDGQTRGGSKTASVPVQQPKQQEPPAQAAPPPPPPAARQEPPQKEVAKEEPAEEKPKAREVVKKEEPEDDPEPVKTVKTPKLDLTPSTRGEKKTATKLPKLDLRPTVKTGSNTSRSTSTSTTRNSSQSQNKVWQDLAKNIGGVGKNIRERTGGSTAIEMPGTGEGGEVYVNYKQLVISAYDRAWFDPSDVADENATVKTEIIVARDGRIIEARIAGRSGIPALDKSVQSALNRVMRLPPFPEGSTDRQRTFIIRFNLKSKRALG